MLLKWVSSSLFLATLLQKGEGLGFQLRLSQKMGSRSVSAARRYSVYRSTLEMIWSKPSKLQVVWTLLPSSSCYADLLGVADTGWDSCLMLVTVNTPPSISHGGTETCTIARTEPMWLRLSLKGSKIILKSELLHGYCFPKSLFVGKVINKFMLKQFLWSTSTLFTVVRLSWILVLSTNFCTNPSRSSLHNVAYSQNTLPNAELEASLLCWFA